jgi:hypothetical protein
MYDEYRGYLFGQLDAREGDPAPDWKSKLEWLTTLTPPFGKNPPPGQVTPADAPHHGITIMIDGGGNARGRIWLPTDDYVESGGNRWYTHEMQVIADGPSGGIVWAWQDKGGASVRSFSGSPVQPPVQPPGGGGGGGGGLTEEDVRRMIDEALAPIYAEAVFYGMKVGLKTQEWDGKEGRMVSARRDVKNTPLYANQDHTGNFETFTVKRGE